MPKKRGGSSSECQNGHSGPICGDCIIGFSKIGNACLPCVDTSTFLMRIFGIFALTIYLLMLFGYIM